MISDTLFTIVMSSLGTLLVVSVVRDLKQYKERNAYYPEHNYQIGDRVIVNTDDGRPILCEIIEQRRFKKSRECCYKMLVYYDKGKDVRVQTIREERIQCTDVQFGLRNLNTL